MARRIAAHGKEETDSLRRQIDSWKRLAATDAKSALQHLDDLLAQREGLLHAIGSVLAETIERKHYLLAGFATFDELLASRGMGRSQAYKWIAVARALEPAKASRLGIEEAYGVVSRRGSKKRRRPPKT